MGVNMIKYNILQRCCLLKPQHCNTHLLLVGLHVGMQFLVILGKIYLKIQLYTTLGHIPRKLYILLQRQLLIHILLDELLQLARNSLHVHQHMKKIIHLHRRLLLSC